jgi:putative ABC transport system substrate-binding protein
MIEMKKTRTMHRSAIAFFLLALCILSTPQPASSAEITIGVIMTGNLPYYNNIHEAFSEQLKSEGLGPEKVQIILQRPVPTKMSWINALRKLVAYDADVIVAYGAPAAMIAITETSRIPIVFAGVYDPHALGLVRKNTTGISSKVPIVTTLKYFKLISDFLMLGVTFNGDEKDTILQANEIKKYEKEFGFRSVPFNIKNKEDVTEVSGVNALLLTTCGSAAYCLPEIIDIVRKEKIPTASIIGGGENSGIILTITANPQEQGIEAAKLTAQVIKGANPSSLPVKQNKKVDMIINLKEATNMGIKVPFNLLNLATKVIK